MGEHSEGHKIKQVLINQSYIGQNEIQPGMVREILAGILRVREILAGILRVREILAGKLQVREILAGSYTTSTRNPTWYTT